MTPQKSWTTSFWFGRPNPVRQFDDSGNQFYGLGGKRGNAGQERGICLAMEQLLEESLAGRQVAWKKE
jgi:hypothetical protein